MSFDLVEMLEVVAAEVELAQSGEGPPGGEEEQIVFGETTVLEVDVDETLSYRVEHDAETIAHVAVAEVQSSQHRQSLIHARVGRFKSG